MGFFRTHAHGAYTALFLFTRLISISGMAYAQESAAGQFGGENFSYDKLVSQSKARADFYQGVELLNTGNIAESVVALQRAVSEDPDNNFMRHWLSRANNAYGNIDFAESIMRELLRVNFLPTYISAKLELLNLRYSIGNKTLLEDGIRNAVRAASIDVTKYHYKLPMSLRVMPSGSMLLTSLGSNSVSMLSPMAGVQTDFIKTAALINRPTDSIALRDGTVLVTEFQSDDIVRFSVTGQFLGSFIKGEVPEKFKGPQFLAVDDDGNVYVSSFGSALIVKFDRDGTFLTSFGGASGKFDGLVEPTGIAVIGERLWVVNTVDKKIYATEYDLNGNFIGLYFVGDGNGESLRAYGNLLVLTAHTQVVVFDTVRYVVTERFTSTDFVKLTSAVFDVNDMLWVVDQQRQRLEAFSQPAEQYAGLQTSILSVRTEQFPDITARVIVSSVSGAPVVGLNKNSFVVFEDDKSVESVMVADDTNTLQRTNVILIPITSGQGLHKTRIENIVRQLVESSDEKKEMLPKFWVMRESGNMGYEIQESDIGVQIVNALTTVLDNYDSRADTPEYRQQTFRIAVNTLLPLAGKKVVLFVGEAPTQRTLDSLSWKQTMRTAKNNLISTIWTYIPSPDVRDSSQGGSNTKRESRKSAFTTTLQPEYFSTIFRPVNVFEYSDISSNNIPVNLMQRIRQPQQGVYTINFTSKYGSAISKENYIEKYVSLAVESYYFNRSGKDIGGYILSSGR